MLEEQRPGVPARRTPDETELGDVTLEAATADGDGSGRQSCERRHAPLRSKAVADVLEAWDFGQFAPDMLSMPDWLRERLEALFRELESARPPAVRAVFEVESGGAVGTREAPVKRVETEDDGSTTVVVDAWPSDDPDEAWMVAAYKRLRSGMAYVVKCKSATFYCGGHTVQDGTRGYAEAFDDGVREAMGLPPINRKSKKEVGDAE